MAINLGDIFGTAVETIGNVFGDWVGADGSFGLDSTLGWAPTLGPTVAAGPAVFTDPVAGVVLAPSGPGSPPMPPGPPPPPGGCNMNDGPSPVWKKVCGVYKWVYPKRRRRKQLLTQSDAVALAQLKGIIGAGKTMDTWIATHPS